MKVNLRRICREAGITEAEVERAARALYYGIGFEDSNRSIPAWEDASKARRAYRRRQARVVLIAAEGLEEFL